ncbi:nascent polypeptide-associated complex subunit alpha, muscle-specific form-like [Schistocerca piceifrons]|uniref:nascent polypeptide-associated complex subunit alpha, muscle-specific form-like n=1 Tax=Schistocerca piceifrons TaxID=274613 RepID=UPI001F5FE173|nr:nascent polypeptide-associated complex subunit alpha, muscle-specific form-like [Schistocerca piceifrons]
MTPGGGGSLQRPWAGQTVAATGARGLPAPPVAGVAARGWPRASAAWQPRNPRRTPPQSAAGTGPEAAPRNGHVAVGDAGGGSCGGVYVIVHTAGGTRVSKEGDPCHRPAADSTPELPARRYNVTMKVRSKEPVTLRTYQWCMKVPPRCSKYHTELREVDRTQVVSRDRLVEECCAGFQKDQDRCVPVADDPSQAAREYTPVPEWITTTDTETSPPPFSAAAEVSAQQKGAPPAAAFPKKDTRLAKKGAPDKTAFFLPLLTSPSRLVQGLDKEKPLPLDALAGESRPATESPETQTSPPPSPPPLPPELDLPPLLDMPPVPAMSDHNQSLTAGSEPPGPGRSGRRRIPPENGHPLLHSDLPAIHWTERAEPGAAAHDEGDDEGADHEVLTSTPHAELPPESISKDAISKGAPRKKASDVKEVPAYARKTATPPPAAGAEWAAAGGPEEGSWEPWGRQAVPKELQGGGEPVAIEHHVLNGRRKAAHAKRGRGEDLKSLPPGKDPGVGLLVMADPPPLPVEAPPAQPAPDPETTMPTWLPVAIGGSSKEGIKVSG